jgi:polar amino acid transport system substrate-binding protein
VSRSLRNCRAKRDERRGPCAAPSRSGSRHVDECSEMQGRSSPIRRLAALITLGAACAALANAPGAATLDQIKQRGYMVVATQDNLPPFEYETSRGVIGYDNELLLGLRQISGLKIRQEVVPLCAIVPGLASGKYDVAVTALAVTPAQALRVSFTTPVADTTLSYIKRKDDRSIARPRDLQGKTVGIQKCSGFAASLSSAAFPGTKHGTRPGKVVEYDSHAEAYEDLVRGRLDAVLGNGASLARMARETSGLFETGTVTSTNVHVAWAVEKGNRSLLEFLNDYIARQRTNGALSRLQLKYDLLGNGS